MARASVTQANRALGQRVKSAREQRGLSQQQLAAIIGASQSCISLWENGINGANMAGFFQLADALRVDARWLATGSSGGEAIQKQPVAVRRQSPARLG